MEQMRIRVSTDVLIQRADTAQQKIQDVKSRFEKIADIVKKSKNYWEGDANEAHCREFRDYKNDIDEALARFTENIIDLKKIANVYHEAEVSVEEVNDNLPMDIIV